GPNTTAHLFGPDLGSLAPCDRARHGACWSRRDAAGPHIRRQGGDVGAQSWVTRRARRMAEGGAVGLETIGIIVLSAVLVGALVFSLTVGTPLAAHVEAAVCKILTVGQGSCDVGERSAEDRIPPEPCVTNASGHSSQASVSFVVTLGK